MNFSQFKTFCMSQIGCVTTLSMPHAALIDVREKVPDAQRKMPAGTTASTTKPRVETSCMVKVQILENIEQLEKGHAAPREL